MKIAVVGAINYDHIITYDKKEYRSLGGILYNVLALTNIFEEDTTICPITFVGKEEMKEISKILAPYSNIDTSGIHLSPDGTNENVLRYPPNREREEVLKSRIPSIDIEYVSPFWDSDIILFNFISGFEIPIETIKQTAKHSQATLIMDIHNLVFGMDGEGRRYPRAIEGWPEWVQPVSIIQTNKVECGLLVGRALNDEDSYVQAAKEILKQGPKTVLLTLGTEGSMVVNREDDRYYSSFCSAYPIPAEQVVDTTGCGDSFIAGFIYGLLHDHNPIKANALANVVAGLNCRNKGLSESTENFKSAEGLMNKHYFKLLRRIKEGYRGEKV